MRHHATPLREAQLKEIEIPRQAAQRRAAVRRSDLEAMSLYGGNVRTKPKLCAHGCQIAVPWVRPSDARRPSALIPRLVRGPSDALPREAARHYSAGLHTFPKDRQKDKPRSVGPRCGDLTVGLSALWRQCPRETQAMRPRQPNRRAGGRPGDARRAKALDSALGARPTRCAPQNAALSGAARQSPCFRAGWRCPNACDRITPAHGAAYAGCSARAQRRATGRHPAPLTGLSQGAGCSWLAYFGLSKHWIWCIPCPSNWV
jgi:hypothetical protein